MQTSQPAGGQPLKSAEERSKGLAAYYWSNLVREEPAKPVKLPETLPPDHPWAACWLGSRFAGKEVIFEQRIVRS